MSIPCVSKNTLIPSSFNSLTYLSVSTVFLANLDIDFTSILFIFPALQSFIILINSGLSSAFVPVIP